MSSAHPKGTRMPANSLQYNPLALPVMALCVECEGLLCSPCCSLQTHPRDDYALPPPSRGEATPRATRGVRMCVNGCVGSMRTKTECHSCFGGRKAKEVQP